jgi:hypothetical protein
MNGEGREIHAVFEVFLGEGVDGVERFIPPALD